MKRIELTNVPEELYRELVRRASARGVNLSDYVRAILDRELARPATEEVFERIARRRPVNLGESAAELLRRERECREAS